ncbi:HAD family hydrolase [Marinilabiliaceae bacterium ANBcel2]|nr:HAD family hydrolase [Marinilabiliaceae bacterium ANBcel2]
MAQKNIVLVDLDGTLYKCNTFRKYLLWSVNYYLRRGDFRFFLILLYAGFRYFRFISHAQMKLMILKTTSHIKSDELHQFISEIDSHYDYKLAEKIEKMDGFKVLSTAAPENYVQLITKNLFFDSYLATPMPGKANKWIENIREHKVETLNELSKKVINGAGAHLDSVITDHHDDIHLMKLFDKVYLRNPDEVTINVLNKQKVKYSVL